jgi:multiple sugar transport system permease protein
MIGKEQHMASLRMSKMARQEALWGYAMVAPLLIGLAIFFYVGLGASLYLSFTEWDVLTPPVWVGLDNYQRFFENPLYLKTLWNSLRFTLMLVPLGMLAALGMALALNREMRLRGLYRVLFFLPVLTMPVAIAVVWKWIYAPDFGLINQVLALFGGPRVKWLSDVNTAMFALVLMSVWSGSGYGMIIYLAGLQNISRSYYEAAQVDGASGWQQFTSITVPLLTPTIFFSLVTSTISAFQVFDIVFVMTKGGPMDSTRTMVYTIYDDGFRFFRMGAASATAWVLFAMILIITIVQLWGQRRWVHYD